MRPASGTLSRIFSRHCYPLETIERRPEVSVQEKVRDFSDPDEYDDDGFEKIGKGPVGEGDVLLTVQGLEKTYRQGNRYLHILQKLNLRLRGGEITALVGPSGSGKSTLLHILGLLDTATAGQLIIGDQIVGKMRDRARTRLRNQMIGFVYQFHHLLPEFNALENVAMPLIIAGTNLNEAKDRAKHYLDAMGLADRVKHRPAELSGGEQQRVAIARALANEPKILLADEPTGNLDPVTSAEVFDILLDQVRNRGIGALIATHNISLAEEMDRILELKGGRLIPY
ncbi:MAG: ABC transporter ATP-binding protein [Alphaproteobacteria bacterium]|nr:ABC transporter ATP-binding protein [Alphaproteobacteria bacterium]